MYPSIEGQARSWQGYIGRQGGSSYDIGSHRRTLASDVEPLIPSHVEITERQAGGQSVSQSVSRSVRQTDRQVKETVDILVGGH